MLLTPPTSYHIFHPVTPIELASISSAVVDLINGRLCDVFCQIAPWWLFYHDQASI